MDRDYWQKAYQYNKVPDYPSSFAQFCLHQMKPGATVYDIGSGNNRDGDLFSERCTVIPVDYAYGSGVDIKDFMSQNHDAVEYVYSRFFLHAIHPDLQSKFLQWCRTVITKKLMIECRSQGDKKTRLKGDHYRRPINGEALLQELIKIGFTIDYYIKSRGLAKLGNEDPLIIRVIARA